MTALDTLRMIAAQTTFRGRVFVVGGSVRDRLLGKPPSGDLDLLVVGDALAFAHMIERSGVSEHRAVVYPRFGTARVQIGGVGIELASARAESYDPRSRKPIVRSASLLEDVLRRDFTVNTLAEGLHDSVLLDLTGRGLADLDSGILRTPLDPASTFKDDPLRMLRAIRFAVTLSFDIENATWEAICRQNARINLLDDPAPVVSAERVRDEFTKILMSDAAPRGLELLLKSGLLSRFLPELCAMKGVEQNNWHDHDVWDHTMRALGHLGSGASLTLRLAVLFHDIGKPLTKSEDERGVHFYGHEKAGAELTQHALRRLRFPAAVIKEATDLVGLHMRLGQVRPEWSDGAVRRLIREAADRLPALFDLADADIAAMGPAAEPVCLDQIRSRIKDVDDRMNASSIQSPLNGREIMGVLGTGPGPVVGHAKEFLVEQVLDGVLAPDDHESAVSALRRWAAQRGIESAS